MNPFFEKINNNTLIILGLTAIVIIGLFTGANENILSGAIGGLLGILVPKNE